MKKQIIYLIKKILDIFIKILIFSTILLGLLAIIKPDLIKNFIEWMRGIIQLLGNYNYLIIFFSSLIEGFPVLGVVVPGQNILLIVGGFFGNIDKNNLFYVIIIASIGAIISNYLGYILGKYYGEIFFKKYGIWFGIGKTEAKYLKTGVKKWGAWGIIIGKFHNLARAFVPFIAGSMGMNQKSFIIYNIIGSIIRAITIVILGVLFASFYETVIDYIGYILIIIMIIIGIYIWLYKKKEFLKYIEEKNIEIDEITK